ncbi:hypothetical protein KTH_30630 [Thermosporothrix hazakensis]|nr:hypothetical protein KTH_30630 [Thermosporothrix hazakensis]
MTSLMDVESFVLSGITKNPPQKSYLCTCGANCFSLYNSPVAGDVASLPGLLYIGVPGMGKQEKDPGERFTRVLIGMNGM